MIYNIKNQNATKNLKVNWDTKNSRKDLDTFVIPRNKVLSGCNNFFSINNDICDIRPVSNRFSSYSLIKSSNLDSVSNNNNLPNIFANFENSYENIIHLAKYYKSIKN